MMWLRKLKQKMHTIHIKYLAEYLDIKIIAYLGLLLLILGGTLRLLILPVCECYLGLNINKDGRKMGVFH